jgi:hypothetical protein
MLDLDGESNVNFHFHHSDGAMHDRFCNAWVAAAIVGSGIISAATTAYSANKAASAQTQANDTAAQLQANIFNKTQENLAPFINEGGTATNLLNAKLPELTSPITMDQNTLEKTPGYQFNLTQGLKATQNSAAARGLGISGAALKGASTFATGLADSTYQNQFNNANINQTNAYNRLKGLIDTGAQAATGQGQIGAATGANVSSNLVGAGNAQAAAYNATGAAVNNLANNVGGYAAYKGLYGGGFGGNNNGSGLPIQYNLPNPNGGGNAVGYGP